MTLPPFVRTLTPIGWTLTALALVAAIAGAWWLVTAPQRAATARAEGKLSTGLAEARTASASDAIQITVDAAKRDAEADHISRENADDIRKAPGADQAVDPAVTAAGLRGLCVRRAYRCSAHCVQLLGPVEPPASCSGG